ncbi:alanine--tRNA ligase [Actinopolymorpha alba]|uniref:alanine--tRNA ligase n=1 Tax=Actinopolymorpha alba TaxID=533267 RepID=UPI0003722F81|nr:alanine--tRNA ligase [Actinopolymorpha alba]
MRSVEIRRTFLEFFRQRDHLIIPSSSLVPDDPTLLLTTAGMVQFKPYFLGVTSPPHPRLTSVQKCVRTVDIDSIGQTDRHTTFFEMLGNFSFGDYGKGQAIAWAYELLTEGFGLDAGRLWATVHPDDDEAVALWREIGIPAERIQRLEENFWDTGGPGPCGLCSEIFYDRGPEFGEVGGPAVNPERYLEVWNLVFMRYLRGEGGDGGAGGIGAVPIVGELPRPCIESGLGLDRLAVVLQNVANVHETDLLAPTLELVAELAESGRSAKVSRSSGEFDRSVRVVADHVRAAAFLLADGVLPSNEGRGYVVRRLVRRAVRQARQLGIDQQVLPELAASVIDHLGDRGGGGPQRSWGPEPDMWPELLEHRSLIERALGQEEEAFDRTLRQGSRLLATALGRTRDESAPALSGQTAFDLHDRYGFPIDLTVEIARETGIEVDTERFAALMEDQRQRARRAGAAARETGGGRAYQELAGRHGTSRFVGYEHLSAEGIVRGILDDGVVVPAVAEGQRAELVLDQTPFYAESGGQVGDTGTIRTAGGAEVRVLQTTYGVERLHVHLVEVVRGEVRAGEMVEAVVDRDQREATARSHSATHVLHAMLRQALGEHARQRGSLVAPGRLRFDFTHVAALDREQLGDIEEAVNHRLLSDPEVRVWETSRAEARAAGAIALFGERYAETVRVVDIGDFSRELCGGTHVGHGSQAGPVRLLGETSVGAGVRRIEALTGLDALRYADHERRLLEQLGSLLGVDSGAAQPDQLLGRLQQRLTALTVAERELAGLRQRNLAVAAERLAGRRRDLEGGRGLGWLVAERLGPADGQDLRTLAEAVLERCPSDRPGGVILGQADEGKAQLVLALGQLLVDQGVRARDLLASAGRRIGGGAGGKGSLAHAGGREVRQLDAGLALAVEELTARCDGG